MLSVPAGAESLYFTDTQFADEDWMVETFHEFGQGGWFSTAHSETGGHPGACQLTNGHLNAADPDAPSGVWRKHLDVDAVWDPASMGTPTCLEATFDGSTSGNGTTIFLIAQQDGHVYRGHWGLYFIPLWGSPWEETGLPGGVSSMMLLEGGEYDPDAHPDTSPTGSPITFGFMLCHELDSGEPEVDCSFAFDNWSLEVQLVPEASTLAGLPLLLLWRRRIA
jgi:hypothetical protein